MTDRTEPEAVPLGPEPTAGPPPGVADAQTILESIGEMFYAVDHRWRLTYVNRRTEEVWGDGART
jgi:hypothetical protein